MKNCTHCNEEIHPDETYCSACGEKVPVVAKKSAAKIAEKDVIKKASKTILVLSILFVGFGTVFGLIQHSAARDAHANLNQFQETDELQPINGEIYTVAELRSQIDKEVLFVFGINYFLAAVMLGLYFWSRESPFPALVAALSVYLAVQVLNAIIDPATIIQGLLIKILIISFLLNGIKTSLNSRKMNVAA